MVKDSLSVKGCMAFLGGFEALQVSSWKDEKQVIHANTMNQYTRSMYHNFSLLLGVEIHYIPYFVGLKLYTQIV